MILIRRKSIRCVILINKITCEKAVSFIRRRKGEVDMKRKHRFYGGFQYAFAGIKSGIQREQNMKMHCLMTILVIVAGVFFKLSVIEWCICILLCGLIMALELVNTAIEAVVDLVTEEQKPLAKLAKDTAAGAVFLLAISAAVIGGIIFFSKIWVLIK